MPGWNQKAIVPALSLAIVRSADDCVRGTDKDARPGHVSLGHLPTRCFWWDRVGDLGSTAVGWWSGARGRAGISRHRPALATAGSGAPACRLRRIRDLQRLLPLMASSEATHYDLCAGPRRYWSTRQPARMFLSILNYPASVNSPFLKV